MEAKPPKPAPSYPASAGYYQLGLCGLTSGGKTCLLAALSLPRVPHPHGLTATLLPLGTNPRPDLKEGWEWVSKARAALEAGKVPPPNPHSGNLTLRYIFTDENRREILIELVDYSGELLDSRNSQSSLAERLRTYLRKVDGLLFIAEHPKLGESSGELAGYLQNLKEAHGSHRADARDEVNLPSAPIALLINKWDRRGPLSEGENAHKDELQKLDTFFQTTPKPPHADLLASLESASAGVCKAFPASAFGEAVREPTDKPGEFKEKPARVTPQLPAFGIDEPFLWLAKQCDLADAARIERNSRRQAMFWNPISLARCCNDAKKTLLRMPATSPEVARIRKAKSKLRVKSVFQFLFFLGAILGVELSKDAIDYRMARSCLTNSTDPTGYTEAEKWYSSYINAPQFRHSLHKLIFVSYKKATEELDQARNLREDAAWLAVSSETDIIVRARLVEEFIRLFPQSPRIPEAKAFVEQALVAKENQKLEGDLIAYEKQLAGIKEQIQQEEQKSDAVQDFKKIADELENLQRKIETSGNDLISDDLNIRKNAIASIAGDLMVKLSQKRAKGDDRKKYHELAARSDWENAAKFLAGLPAKDFQDLRAHFHEKAMFGIEDKARNKYGNGAGWETALQYLKGFQKEPIRGLLPPDAMGEFARLENDIKQKGDRWLYAQCLPNAGLEPFIRYRDEAPLKSMRPQVEDWVHFLELRQKPGRFRMGVSRIKWSPSAKDADTVFGGDSLMEISLGEAIEKPHFDSNRKGEWVSQNNDCKVVAKEVDATKPQRIFISLYDVDDIIPFDDNELLGKFEDKKLPEEIQGLQLDLKGSDYGISTVTLSMEVEDGGEWKPFTKPRLPAWEKPR